MKISIYEKFGRTFFIGGCFCVALGLFIFFIQSVNGEGGEDVIFEEVTKEESSKKNDVENEPEKLETEPEELEEKESEELELEEEENKGTGENGIVNKETESVSEEIQTEEADENIEIERAGIKIEKKTEILSSDESNEEVDSKGSGDENENDEGIEDGNDADEIKKDESEDEDDEEECEEEQDEFEIIISEVVIGDESSTKNEFVELYNFSEKEIDLKGFSLKKRTKGGSSKSNLVSSSKFSGTIGAGKFFVIKNQKHTGVIDSDLEFSGSSYSITTNNRIYLEDSDGNLVDAIGWGICEKDCEEGIIFDELKEGQSLSARLNDKPKQKYAKKFEVTNIKTPGQENIFSSEIEYPKNVLFSEVLSNPEGTDKNFEWIELENKNMGKIVLSDWVIENGSGKRFKMKEVEMAGLGFGLIQIKDSSFVVRNSNEELKLIDPAENIIDSLSIAESAPSGISFGKTEERGWCWNRKQTPNAKNIANNLPKIEIEKDKKIYKNIYTEFDASETSDKDHDELKFVWDFGDGHKSYQEETKHKYEKNGKYRIFLTVKDGFEELTEDFKITVKSFPRREIRITSLLPNPKGTDSGNEMIEIENLSSKKINLLNFYIATGKKFSSLVRHQILEDFILKPGEKRFISNKKLCKFSLLNKGGKVKLLYPDGKGAFKLEYEKEKIGDDDVFQFNGNRWEWIVANLPTKQFAKQFVSQEDIDKINQETEANKEIKKILNVITHNVELKICETYLKMQIENWRNVRENPLQFFWRENLNKRMSSMKLVASTEK